MKTDDKNNNFITEDQFKEILNEQLHKNFKEAFNEGFNNACTVIAEALNNLSCSHNDPVLCACLLEIAQSIRKFMKEVGD